MPLPLAIRLFDGPPRNCNFPQESHFERRRKVKPGAIQRRNLSPRINGMQFWQVVRPPCRREWSWASDGGGVTWWGLLSCHTYCFLFKPEPTSEPQKMGLGAWVTGPLYSFLSPIWSHWINLLSLLFSIICIFTWPKCRHQVLRKWRPERMCIVRHELTLSRSKAVDPWETGKASSVPNVDSVCKYEWFDQCVQKLTAAASSSWMFPA